MDFHRDSLLNIPNVTVFSCQEQEGYIILKLDFLNEGITCPQLLQTTWRRGRIIRARSQDASKIRS